jgi:hypothetical protein
MTRGRIAKGQKVISINDHKMTAQDDTETRTASLSCSRKKEQGNNSRFNADAHWEEGQRLYPSAGRHGLVEAKAVFMQEIRSEADWAALKLALDVYGKTRQVKNGCVRHLANFLKGGYWRTFADQGKREAQSKASAKPPKPPTRAPSDEDVQRSQAVARSLADATRPGCHGGPQPIAAVLPGAASVEVGK